MKALNKQRINAIMRDMEYKKILDFISFKLPFIQSRLIKEIPTLNYGGCGAFALHMSPILTELQIKHEIILLSEYDTKITTEYVNKNRSLYRDALKVNKGDVNFYHVVLKIKDWWFDGHKILNSRDKVSKYKLFITFEDLEIIYENRRIWNKEFKRKTEIPKLINITHQIMYPC